MVRSVRWRGALYFYVSALLGCCAVSRSAFAQYSDETQAYDPSKAERRREDVGPDDVEQRSVGRVEATESERQARERQAREDDAPYDPSDPKRARLDVAIRSGYAVPVGDVADGGGEIADVAAGQVPIWADVGVRYDKRSFFGLYFSYGIGVLSDSIADACDRDAALSEADVSCSERVLRFGLEYLYHAQSSPSIDPWIGFGVGWEWLSVSESASLDSQSGTISLGFNGVEYFNLQAGVDYTLSDSFSLGPFLLFTLASYGNASIDCEGACNGADVSADITEQSTHSWLGVGVKATFVP